MAKQRISGLNYKLKNNLSDHIEQIALVTTENQSSFKVATHNMMEKCSGRNNGFGANETPLEYQARLDLLQDKYIAIAYDGSSAILLQETPRDAVTREAFKVSMVQNLPGNWGVEEQDNGRGQPLLMFYNMNDLTLRSNFTNETLTQGAGKLKTNIAQIGHFKFNGEDVDLVNVHLASTHWSYQEGISKTQQALTALMSSPVLTIRAGDHNGDNIKFSDLQSGCTQGGSCISYNFNEGKLYNNQNKYDGFASNSNTANLAVESSPWFKILPDLSEATIEPAAINHYQNDAYHAAPVNQDHYEAKEPDVDYYDVQQQQYLLQQQKFNAINDYREDCKATFLQYLKDLNTEISDICTMTITNLEPYTQGQNYSQSEKENIMGYLRSKVDSDYIKEYLMSLNEGNHEYEIQSFLKIHNEKIDKVHAKISETADASLFLWFSLEQLRCSEQKYDAYKLVEIADDMAYKASNANIEELFTPELCGNFFDMDADLAI